MFLLLALATASNAQADTPELRTLGDNARVIRVDVPVGEVSVTRDASLSDIELRTSKLNWADTCELEILGSLRTRVQIQRPFLPREECSMKMDLRIPAGVDVIVNVGEGDVALYGLVNDAKVMIDDGSLALTDVRGELTVRMDNGEVSGTHSSQVVDLQLTDETITLEGISKVAGQPSSQEDSG